MDILRRLTFEIWYLHQPPWETGIVPPEVAEFIAAHPPGRALDLGCGTGTSSLALRKAGWEVSGIDFSSRAIRIAQKKARLAGLDVDFTRADIVRLPPKFLEKRAHLVLDIGCFHGLANEDKATYHDQLVHLLIPGGYWLLYGFFKPTESTSPGMLEQDLVIHGNWLNLLWRRDGLDKLTRPSAWLLFQRNDPEGMD